MLFKIIKRLVAVCLLLPSVLYAQSSPAYDVAVHQPADTKKKYVYVNTSNLIVRSSPHKNYVVIGLLVPPTQLEIIPFDDSDRNTAFQNQLYKVLVRYERSSAYTTEEIPGYVDKKYVVDDIAKVTAAPGTRALFPIMENTLVGTYPDLSNSFDVNNRFRFPYPESKGGDPSIYKALIKEKVKPVAKREYHTGVRGGCYYINSAGHHVYVDKRFCK